MEYIEYGYFGLFVVCFLSATILPLSSEGVLILFLSLQFDPLHCLIIASIGNTLGGTTNYALGKIGNPSTLEKLFKRPERYNKLNYRIKKYGSTLALISWVPLIGDPLVIALGYFRVPFLPVFLLMAFAKTARYSIIIFIMN